jgi:UDP-glucuronate 4-epimerase
MKILLTGGAGFIGSQLALQLLERGDEVVIIDNINDYYDVSLKYARLERMGIFKKNISLNKEVFSDKYKNLIFIQAFFENNKIIADIFTKYKFDKVCHLGAQAGVRYSLENPRAYIDSNIVGFFNIIENAKLNNVKHFVYASSSSVYGLNDKIPFSTEDKCETPASLYAATKKSNELISHTYSHLYNLPTIALRFFTVYGEWGRPDMALFKFVKNILEDKEIDVYNNGDMLRDFTYIDDILKGIIKCIDVKLPSSNKYRVYNIGNNNPVNLMDFIKEIEKQLNKKAKINFMPIQDGDVPNTYANVDALIKDFDYKPDTTIRYGIEQFVKWYLEYFKINK